MQVVQLKLVQTVSVAAALTAAALAPASAQDAKIATAAPSAPPIATAAAPPADAPVPDPNVWNWQDVPRNQQIVIDRAVFDQGGYQLYCHTGETIVVPFTDHNLYEMKFGQCDGPMYFTTDGATPVLYIPVGGYLENAMAPGAKWYPFPRTFDYLFPVYVGPAPSWDEYAGMGWYPGMVYYGGYWSGVPFAVGVALAPTPGWFVAVDGWEIDSWQDFSDYAAAHPARRVLLTQDRPGYGYDRFPPRGPQVSAAAHGGRPFGGESGQPSATLHTPHSSGLANPAFHAPANFPVIPVSSRLGNPNRPQPATIASQQIASAKTKPVILGNPRFRSGSAMASYTPLVPHASTAANAVWALTTQNPRQVVSTYSSLGLVTHKSFFDTPGTTAEYQTPKGSEDRPRFSASSKSPRKSSHSSGGFFRKAASSAAAWVHDYARSNGAGGGSGSGRSESSEHSGGHAERESHSSSGGEGGGKKK